jgi:hypothetical protein
MEQEDLKNKIFKIVLDFGIIIKFLMFQIRNIIFYIKVYLMLVLLDPDPAPAALCSVKASNGVSQPRD